MPPAAEIFRIYLKPELAAVMTREQMRGAWEASVLEQGGAVVPGGVTVRQLPNGTAMVAGRAARPEARAAALEIARRL